MLFVKGIILFYRLPIYLLYVTLLFFILISGLLIGIAQTEQGSQLLVNFIRDHCLPALHYRLQGRLSSGLYFSNIYHGQNKTFVFKGMRIQNIHLKIQSSALGDFKISGGGLINTHPFQFWGHPELKNTFSDKPLILSLYGTILLPKGNIILNESNRFFKLSKDISLINQHAQKLPLQIEPHIQLILGNDFYFKTQHLESLISGELKIQQRPDGLFSAEGQLHLKDGKYRLQGRSQFIKQGTLVFPPGTLINNPLLNIQISSRPSPIPEENKEVLYVQGTLQKPLLQLYTHHDLKKSETLSTIALGHNSSPEDDQINILSQSVLLISEQASPFNQILERSLGIEEINLESRPLQKTINTTGNDTALVLGKRLSKRVYLQYVQNMMDPASTIRLKYALSPKFSTSIESGTEGIGGDLIFTVEKD